MFPFLSFSWVFSFRFKKRIDTESAPRPSHSGVAEWGQWAPSDRRVQVRHAERLLRRGVQIGVASPAVWAQCQHRTAHHFLESTQRENPCKYEFTFGSHVSLVHMVQVQSKASFWRGGGGGCMTTKGTCGLLTKIADKSLLKRKKTNWKACIFAFRLMPYLLIGLFHWGVCRVSNLGAMSKRKSCKIDQIVWKMHATCMSCFVLSFCERMHACPLPIHCTEILRNKTCWISNSGAILEHLFFDIASNIIPLHTFVPGNCNK